jgi:hypothetical protein
MAEMKSRVKFNIIDFLIIIAVLGCIAGVAIRFDLAGKLGLNSNKDEVEISFLILNIRVGSVNALNEGDTFYLGTTNGTEFGKLLSKEVTNSESYVLDDNFAYHKVYNDLRYDVRGVFSAKGSKTDSGFMLNGTQFMAPGKTIMIESKNISVSITILSIK